MCVQPIGHVALLLTRRGANLRGGIDTSSTIFLGGNDRVVSDTADVLRDTEGLDHIFTCSCSVDAGLDPERLKLMMATVKGYISSSE